MSTFLRFYVSTCLRVCVSMYVPKAFPSQHSHRFTTVPPNAIITILYLLASAKFMKAPSCACVCMHVAPSPCVFTYLKLLSVHHVLITQAERRWKKLKKSNTTLGVRDPCLKDAEPVTESPGLAEKLPATKPVPPSVQAPIAEVCYSYVIKNQSRFLQQYPKWHLFLFFDFCHIT